MNLSLNPIESFIDPEILSLNFSSISLSIIISHKNLTYCVIDNSQHKYLAIADFAFTEVLDANRLSEHIANLINNEPLLKKDYKSVSISYQSENSTLIPEEIFDKNQLEIYFDFLNFNKKDNLLLYDYLKAYKAFNIYTLPKCLQQVLQKNLVNYKLINSNSGFLSVVHLTNSKTDSTIPMAYLNIENTIFDLVIIKENKLLLNNKFPFKTKEDFLYYLLFALKQLNINAQEFKLILSGKIVTQSAIFDLLTKYIENISFVEKETYVNFSKAVAKLPYHEFFMLYNLHKCE